MTEPKPLPENDIPRFAVYYRDDRNQVVEVEYVRPMPLKSNGVGLEELITLQSELLRYCVFNTAAVGEMLCDPSVLSVMQRIAAMLCIVGKSNNERGINLDNLLETGDYIQIGRIFLSEGYNADQVVPDKDFRPSAIARIHKLNFEGKLQDLNQERLKQAEQEIAKEIQKIPEVPQARIAAEPSPVVAVPSLI